MSYNQAVKHGRKHPKGHRTPVIMSTGSGFWPSGAFLEEWEEYRVECSAQGTKPLGCEAYYNASMKGSLP